MRRPGQILKSLFSHETRTKHSKKPEHEREQKRLESELKAAHDLHVPGLVDSPSRPAGYGRRSKEQIRRDRMQIVHPTKTHPGVKKARNRRRNKVARASRKANR